MLSNDTSRPVFNAILIRGFEVVYVVLLYDSVHFFVVGLVMVSITQYL
jgi:hypothetical protein